MLEEKINLLRGPCILRSLGSTTFCELPSHTQTHRIHRTRLKHAEPEQMTRAPNIRCDRPTQHPAEGRRRDDDAQRLSAADAAADQCAARADGHPSRAQP